MIEEYSYVILDSCLLFEVWVENCGIKCYFLCFIFVIEEVYFNIFLF